MNRRRGAWNSNFRVPLPLLAPHFLPGRVLGENVISPAVPMHVCLTRQMHHVSAHPTFRRQLCQEVLGLSLPAGHAELPPGGLSGPQGGAATLCRSPRCLPLLEHLSVPLSHTEGPSQDGEAAAERMHRRSGRNSGVATCLRGELGRAGSLPRASVSLRLKSS